LEQKGAGLNHNYEQLTESGDKVVIDHATGLMWQQGGALNHMDYEDAKKWIAELNKKDFAGYYDWRLPTLEEAMSLMEREKRRDLYIDPVFDSKQSWIWTSDFYKGGSRAWVVSFGDGGCGDYNFFNLGSYVRAVRSGQSSKE